MFKYVLNLFKNKKRNPYCNNYRRQANSNYDDLCM